MSRAKRAETPQRVWVIGDLHGCAAELDRLLDVLDPAAADEFIFLGDYIDRGPNARGVVDRLLRLQREIVGCTFLRGNHEDMFLGFLGRAGHFGDSFRRNGGAATLRSYGVEDLSPRRVAERLPQDHLDFFDHLQLQVEHGGFLCAHAGVDPRRPLAAQRDEDLMWIREDFLRRRGDLARTIVHGHNPGKQVVLDLPYRIGLDTGVVYGNRLSCLDLLSGDLVQIRSATRAVERRHLDLSQARSHRTPKSPQA